LGFVEMHHLVFDSFWQSQIRSAMQSQIIVLEHGHKSIEVDKKPSCLMVSLHDHVLELYFGIGDLVVGAEIQVKLFRECQVIRSPYRFTGGVIYKVRLKVVESCFLEEGQDVVHFRRTILESLGFGMEIQRALEKKALEFLRVLTIEWIGFPEFFSRVLFVLLLHQGRVVGIMKTVKCDRSEILLRPGSQRARLQPRAGSEGLASTA
jgi:hypothetical protein